MAGHAKKVQAGDVNVVRAWKTLMANRLRAVVTNVQASAVQANVAKLIWVSTKARVIMRQETYVVVLLIQGCMVWLWGWAHRWQGHLQLDWQCTSSSPCGTLCMLTC